MNKLKSATSSLNSPIPTNLKGNPSDTNTYLYGETNEPISNNLFNSILDECKKAAKILNSFIGKEERAKEPHFIFFFMANHLRVKKEELSM